MNHLIKPGLMFLIYFVSLTVSTAQEVNSEFDSFLEVYTATWNKHNGDALASLYTADADMIMGNLPLITGREAIGGSWNKYFSQIDQSRKGIFELISLRDITPDVRLVNISSKTFGSNKYGEELETRLARGTWILVKRVKLHRLEIRV